MIFFGLRSKFEEGGGYFSRLLERSVGWLGEEVFLVVASYLRKGIFLSKNRKPIESEK